MSGPTPSRIGRFTIQRELGRGAFGVVYRAHDPQLQRDIALKVPNASVMKSPHRIERFLREARAAANLRHPNIVPLFEAGQEEGDHYIASAFVEGENLAAVVAKKKLPYRKVAEIVRQLAEALAYAHGQGIVHRDIKPANVMLDRDGRPHLMDFGLAARADESEKLTTDGALLGTPSYMAPEQIRGQAGPGSDQYSLGVLLYELLTGRTPFEGPPASVLAHTLKVEPPAPSKVRRGVPLDLETICLKCLSKEPAKRYADCAEMADDLRRYLEGEPIRARRQRVWETVQRWARKSALAASLTAGLLLVLMIGVSLIASSAARSRLAAVRANQEATLADATEEQASLKQAGADRQAGRELRETARADAATGNATRTEALARAAETLRDKARDGLLTLRGHTSAVRSVAFSPDGKRILTGSDDKTAKVWDAETGGQILTLKGHTYWVTSVSFSPDGKRMLTASYDKSAKVWDAEKGTEVLALNGHTANVWSAAFSPDGKRILTGSNDKTAKVWDAETGKEVLALKGHTFGLMSVAYSPDGKRIVTGSFDKTAKVWDADTGAEVFTFKGHTNTVWSVAFSPDGKRILTGSSDSTAKMWDTETGTEILILKGHTGGVTAVAFSPNGERIITGGIDKTARVWAADKEAEALALKRHPADITSAVFSPDGKRILIGIYDYTARLWAADAGN